jgi:RNA polymerase sigma factor (sigma-70 family)
MSAAAILSHLRRLSVAEREDSELLHAFVSRRDDAAFAALVRRHGPLVLGVCRRVLGHEQDAEDAFQAAFLILARKAASLRIQSVGGWLHGVAWNVAQRLRRSAARRRCREAQAVTRPTEGPAAEASLRELQALLDAEVARLPEKLRAAFVACCLEGRSKAEAARDLGWKEGTVSSRLAQAREMLRTRLVRRGVALSAVLTALALEAHASAAMPEAVVTTTTHAAIRFLKAGGDGPGAILAKDALQSMVRGKAKVAMLAMLVLLTVSAIGYQLPAGGGQPDDETKQRVDGSKNNRQPPKADLHGDPLPEGASVRFGTGSFRVGVQIGQLALSPDGKLIAAYHHDRVNPQRGDTVVLLDAATGKEVRRFNMLEHTGECLAFSFDAKLLASADRNAGIHLLDVATGNAVRQLSSVGQGTQPIVVFSDNGKVLAVGNNAHSNASNPLVAWDVTTGKEVGRFPLLHKG